MLEQVFGDANREAQLSTAEEEQRIGVNNPSNVRRNAGSQATAMVDSREPGRDAWRQDVFVFQQAYASPHVGDQVYELISRNVRETTHVIPLAIRGSEESTWSVYWVVIPASSVNAHEQAAIDHEGMPGDESGRVLRKVQYGLGNLGGFRHATERLTREQCPTGGSWI